jgi:hypothetical protein
MVIGDQASKDDKAGPESERQDRQPPEGWPVDQSVFLPFELNLQRFGSDKRRVRSRRL